jgi:hypothetical protein
MKTLVCFLTTWVTATALLVWLATRQKAQQLDLFPGAQITLTTTHPHSSHVFWHSLWVAGVFSLLNTFIVRFWQMQWELREKNN